MGMAIPMLDLMFFLTESEDNPRHVGAILIFERPARGGASTARRILDAYRRIDPLPPFNRIPVFVRAGMPEWQEVDKLDMNWHVQHLTLPAPGLDAQLHELAAKLHAPMLERDRPGWRVYVIEGLERNRFALFIKVHHALVDGESGIALMQHSLSQSPRDRHIRSAVATELPARVADGHAGATQWVKSQAATVARLALAIGLGTGRVVKESLAGLRGFSAVENRPFTAPYTPMNEPIHNARILTHTALPLSSMQGVANAWAATVNDVAICVLDAAMNRYLREAGRRPDRPLVAICPVSLHDPDLKQATTLVTNFWTPLGKPSSPVDQRMRRVIANTRQAKERIRTLPKEAAYVYSVLNFSLGETLPLIRPGSSGFFVPSNVLISNVRGPSEPLYLNGARLEALCPVSTLIAGMGLNITFMSYAGQVVFGFTANASALPNADRMARYTLEAFSALEQHTRRAPPDTHGRPRNRRTNP